MTQIVRVLEGEYGAKAVIDTAFPLVKPFKMGKNGGFITVDATEVKGFPNREIRVKLKSASDYVGTDGTVPVGEDKPKQTDEESHCLCCRFAHVEQTLGEAHWGKHGNVWKRRRKG